MACTNCDENTLPWSRKHAALWLGAPEVRATERARTPVAASEACNKTARLAYRTNNLSYVEGLMQKGEDGEDPENPSLSQLSRECELCAKRSRQSERS